jgi:hypothetical protein
MNHRLTFSIATFGLLISSGVMADEHCTDPVADWQPRETLREQVRHYGWEVQRIKVDDGCYEVRGIDRKGNRFEAKFAPATLQIRSLEVEFDSSANTSDYLLQLQ